MTTHRTTQQIRTTRRPAAPARARGFAFTELLFAVMVLGLGFIMIAAMFPVTIRQTQSTLEETVGAGAARGAIDYLQSVASDDLFPPTVPALNNTTPPEPDRSVPPQFVALAETLPDYEPKGLPAKPTKWSEQRKLAYATIRGNLVDPNNPRVAWIPFYRRFPDSPIVQVIVVAVQCRNRDQYVTQHDARFTLADGTTTYTDFDRPTTPSGVTPKAGFMPSTLEPMLVEVSLQYDVGTNRGRITIDDPARPAGRGRAAPGAYVIIATDTTSHPTSTAQGQAVGRIYQLAAPVDEAKGVWELTPGFDMIRSNAADPTKLAASDDNDLPAGSATAYIIGRGYTDLAEPAKGFTAGDPASGYAGPAQDIAVYSGFIYVPPTPTP